MKSHHVIIIAALSCLGMSCSDDSERQFRDGGPDSLEGMASPQEWSESSTTDLMTDDKLRRITKRIVSERGEADVALICRDGTKLGYEFTLFDNKDRPLSIGKDRRGLKYFTMRRDGDEPQQYSIIHGRLRNSFATMPTDQSVDSIANSVTDAFRGMESLRQVPNVASMAAANSLTFAIPTDRGDFVFRLDQRSPAVRAFIDKCSQNSDMVDDGLGETKAEVEEEDPLLSRVKEGSSGKIQFAQKYDISWVNCGLSCVSLWFFDPITEEVISAPPAPRDDYIPVNTVSQRESNQVTVIYGSRNGDSDFCLSQTFRLAKGGFVPVDNVFDPVSCESASQL